MPLGNVNAVAGARVATSPGTELPHRQRAEASQFDPIAAGQRGGDLAEDRSNSDFGLTPS
jgi:hypothetical protein